MRMSPRASAVAAIVAATAVLTAIPAAAHVHVSGDGVTQGGWGVLTFRAPSESDSAATTELRITFPDDSPIANVSTQPKPGWTATVTRKDLPTPVTNVDGEMVTQYVSEIDFKADPNGGIPARQFDTFSLSVGPLPKQAEVSFPVLQTYSDGKTVNWNERSADGTTEPEHPAPVLTLPATKAAATSSAGADNSWAGWTGLGTGIAALVVSLAALLRSGRKRE